MTKHAFGAKVTGTSVGKCSHVRPYHTVLYCAPEKRKECTDGYFQGTGKPIKTSKCFYLTVWNPANFVGGSSKSHILSEFFRETGTREDFPIQTWENKQLFPIFQHLGKSDRKKNGKRL